MYFSDPYPEMDMHIDETHKVIIRGVLGGGFQGVRTPFPTYFLNILRIFIKKLAGLPGKNKTVNY